MNDFVRATVTGRTGHLSLDRPKAMNALVPQMISAMAESLTSWADDDSVDRVVISSTSPRAFCAGADIRAIRAGVLAHEPWVSSFFEDEYALNLQLAHYPKPLISLMDGVAMGGGLGISVHGSHRIVTERSVLAMPETAIGFIPDVGASHFLPRLPRHVGRYLGLTSARIGGPDAVALGLATHLCPADRLPELQDALLTGVDLDSALAAVCVPVADDDVSLPLTQIEATFGMPSVDDIVTALRRGDSEWCRSTLAAIESVCPTTVYVTDALLQSGARSTLSECLKREAAVGARVIARGDFAEGVRAQLVDKDHRPQFEPATLAEVDSADVQSLLS
ncbi:enoyl-CoA hydratase/isomerase family protein [Rudaeicoccus suwonensis]|nr:enoyl-CoA hydratase/isomerase family protein [Rudaeicoccus suwonensis]